jgi:hypothetical protein
MDWPAIAVALGTWALVLITLALVLITRRIAKEQVKVELYLKLREGFDGARIMAARKALAHQLLNKAPHHEIQEDVMDFFEDMGMLLRRRYVDGDMVWDTFSYYGMGWWSACKDYAAEERRRHGDPTLFTGFEDLAKQIRRRAVEGLQKADLTPPEVEAFLKDEARLPTRQTS